MTAIKQAVALVGGLGSRLGGRTRQTPKPLLSVGGKPFIEYWFDILAAAGIDEILLACSYHAEQFVDRYDGKQWRQTRLHCCDEGDAAGTGGALARLKNLLAKRFFLINGDSLLKPNFTALAAALGESANERLGALTLARRPSGGDRYGAVEYDGEGNVTAFCQKATATRINGGVYAFFAEITKEVNRFPCSLENDILPALATRGDLGGVLYDGDFIDIGVPEALAQAEEIMERFI